MVRKLIWPFGGLSLIALALLVFAASIRFEGPHIMRIVDGRGITLADVIAFVPLFVGSIQLVAGLWQRRGHLRHGIRLSPSRADIVILATGSALSLLLAVATRSYFHSKRPAFAVLFSAMLATAMFIAARKPERHTS